MIHHISISAQNPQRVAQVLAEILNGQTAPFFPHPGSYIVMPLDKYGTAIEVYPLGSELVPGEGEQQCTFVQNTVPSRFTATHAAISVPTTRQEIEQIAAREGWRVLYCNRDSFFDVIEFWVENRLMLELLTPEMVTQYLTFTQPENLKVFLNEPATATI